MAVFSSFSSFLLLRLFSFSFCLFACLFARLNNALAQIIHAHNLYTRRHTHNLWSPEGFTGLL